MSERFPFPPIVEAVIEVRLEAAVEEAQKEKIAKKLAKHYPNKRIQINKGINVNLEVEKVSIANAGTVVTLSNEDQNELLLLGPDGIAVSQLALYSSWEVFFKRFQRDWAAWKAVSGHQKINQIGMRFVNRIDVPLVDHVARHEDYLTLRIQLPNEYPDTIGYSLMARVPLNENQCIATINSGAVPSPIPDHTGILLDIDIIRQVDVPQKDSDIKALLEVMRHAKNAIFQSLITDTARDKFRSG